tara:strand:- start:401 stop:1015 length:615 start_codon:yes stop_codon:yes gene_type:complete
MSKKKKKYYVVWEGNNMGIFNSWDECKLQTKNYKGAKYKSFENKEEAEAAYKISYYEYMNDKPKKNNGDPPNYNSISVDAASSGNPGIMEYQGVDTKSKKILFKQGPFKEATNNIGEFLALVHGLAFLKKLKSSQTIYSDSITAISWVKKKKCQTKLTPNENNKEIFKLIDRAIAWLMTHSYDNQIVKWETKKWGEIPADFGRK